MELQLKFLYTIRKPSILVERLGKLPPGLEKSYQDLYDHQMQVLGEEQSEVTRRILSWLLVAKRPLTTTETCELVCAPEEPDMSPETVVDLCFDLVALDTQLDRFRFAHLSVREFLEKRGEYSQARTHGTATNACLQRLVKHRGFSVRKYETLHWALHAENAVKNGGGSIIRGHLDSFLFEESVLGSWNSWLFRSRALGRLYYSEAGWRMRQCLANAHNNEKGTALRLTAYFGLLEQLKHVVAAMSKSSDDWTNDPLIHGALHLSCRCGQASVVEFFLAQGVDVNARDSYSRSPLTWAVVGRQAAIVELLLKQNGIDLNSPDSYSSSPLSQAVQKDDIAVVELLLKQNGIDFNSCDKHGRSSLSYAAEKNNVEIVKLLLKQNGIDFNSRDKHGTSPLSYAAGKNNIEIVKLLLKQNGIDLNSHDECGTSPLSCAVQDGHTAIVELLLAQDSFDVNSRDTCSHSLLSRAVMHGHTATVELLLAQDSIDVNPRDTYGRSLLSYAVEHGHPAIFELLLARTGIDVNARDNQQWTALHWAAYFGKTEAIDWLRQRGADCTMRDRQGWTPYDVAVFAGYEIPTLCVDGIVPAQDAMPGRRVIVTCQACRHVSSASIHADS